MRRLCFWLFFVFFLFALLAIMGDLVVSASNSWETAGSVTVLESTPQQVLVEFGVSQYNLESVTYGDRLYDLVRVPGSGLVAQDGMPQLPVRTLAIGIPPEVEVHLEVLEVETQILEGNYDIPPSPTFEIEEEWPVPESPEQMVRVNVLGQGVTPNSAVYSTNAFFPERLVDSLELGFIRHQRIASVRLAFAQYNPVTRQIQIVRKAKVRFSFEYLNGMNSQSWTSTLEPGGFEDLLRESLSNYESAREWRVDRIQASERTSFQVPLSDSIEYKVLVTETGLYELSYGDLLQAGLPVDTLDPRTFQVFNEGVESALRVEGEQDGSFDPGDILLFYGEAFEDKYTDANVYWLTYGSEYGLRMSVRDGAPSGTYPIPTCFQSKRHAEDNVFYSPRAYGQDEDFERYYWMAGYAPFDMVAEIPLYDLCTSGTVTVTASFLGGNDDPDVLFDHHVELAVNGNYAGETWWSGIVLYTTVFTFPSSYLQEGINEFNFHSLGDTGAATEVNGLDWFDITYQHAYTADADLLSFGGDNLGGWDYQIAGFSSNVLELYDVTDPAQVEQIVNFEILSSGLTYTLWFSDYVVTDTLYLAQSTQRRLDPWSIVQDSPSDLRSTANGADYIVISHADFLTEAQRLADYRSQQGLRTIVVDLQDIYDEFSFGRANVHAIHDFLAYTFDNWIEPAPVYVVLLGDGHWDYKDYYNLVPDRINYFPPYLLPIDPWIGEVPTDNRYVSVHGADILPDMFVGRLPANSLADAQGMVDKIIAYEQYPNSSWMSRVLFVADNPDSAGNFWSLSDEIANNYLPSPPYTSTKAYLGLTCANATACKAIIRDAYDSGHLLVNYIGHSATEFWAQESIFHRTDVQSLNNPDKLAINLPMTCYDGSFQYPFLGAACIGETFVSTPNKGAVASWSPTGLGVTSGHDYLNKGFFSAVFQDGIRDVGAATYVGKLWLYNSGVTPEQIDEYTLFGDPALHINALDTDLRVEKTVEPTDVLAPGDVLTYTLTFTNTGPAMANNVVLTDLIPALLTNPTVVYSSPEVIAQHPGVSFTWDITDLLPHTGGEIQVRATVDPAAHAQTFVNRADTASRTPDTDTSNNTASLSSQIGIPTYVPTADVRLAKTVEPAGRVDPGDVLTYTLTFVNEGPDTVEHGLLTDFLPSSLIDPIVVYASPAVVSQTAVTGPAGTTFQWGIAELPSYTGGEIQMRVVAGTPVGAGFIVNEAEITSNTPDLDPSNNVVSVTSDVLLPDLFVSKTGPASVMVSQTITYTIAWGNQGSFAAPDVFITDTLPPSVSYVDDSSGFTLTQPSPGVLVWEVAPDPVPTDTSATFVLTGWVQIDPDVVGPLSNLVQIGGTWADDDPANNQSQWSTDLLLPDLQIAKAVEPTGQVDPGDWLTYTLTFTNTGLGMAYGVVVTDLLPATLVNPTVLFSSPVVISQRAGITFAWTVSPLAPDTGGSIEFRAQVSPTLPLGSLVVNEAQIAAGTPDAAPANNTISVTTGIRTPDLFVFKTGPWTVNFGQAITYTLSWGNQGELAAPGVRLTDTLPAGIDYVGDDSGIVPTYDPVTRRVVWQIPGDVPTGTLTTFVLTGWVSVDPGLPSPLVNQARIKSVLPDVNSSDNKATWSTNLLWPDLGIAVDGPAELAVLTQINHTITYSNAGAGLAQGVVISDVLPAGVTYVSDDSGFVHAEPVPGTHTWQVGELSSGGNGSFVVTLAVGDYADVGTAAQATVLIGADTPDANAANNSGEWTAAVLQPDLAVLKSGPASTATNSTITYTLAYSNVGTGPALGVVLTDVLPAGLTYLSDDSSLVHTEPLAGTHVWQVGDLPGGGRGTFHLVIRVGALDQTGALATNSLQIGADSPDVAPGNDESQWATSIQQGNAFIYLPLVVRAAP